MYITNLERLIGKKEAEHLHEEIKEGILPWRVHEIIVNLINTLETIEIRNC